MWDGVTVPSLSSWRIVAASCLTGSIIGAGSMYAWLSSYNNNNNNNNNNNSGKSHASTSTSYSNSNTMAIHISPPPQDSFASSRRRGLNSIHSISNNNNINNNNSITNGTIQVLLRSCVGHTEAEGLGLYEELTEVLGPAPLTIETEEEIIKEKKEEIIIEKKEEDKVIKEEKEKRSGNINPQSTPDTWKQSENVQDDVLGIKIEQNKENILNTKEKEEVQSEASTLEGFFSPDTSIASNFSDDDILWEERNDNSTNNNNNNKAPTLHRRQRLTSTSTTLTATGASHFKNKSYYKFHNYDYLSSRRVSGKMSICSAPPISEDTPLRSKSQIDINLSNRVVYHTFTGAIISRLPSEPSIRRLSLRQILQPPSSRFINKENEIIEEDEVPSNSLLQSQSIISLPDDPIYRIVITGGPCSGKTTCMSYLRKIFESLNFNVFCVPEVATLLHNGGVDLVLHSKEDRIQQQRVILQMMMMLEDAFYELASMRGRPALILYDRGTMDGSAYCSEEEWNNILNVTGYSNEELSDIRYDAVIHLVTAAIGAESYYTLDNNCARSEGIEEAKQLDVKTRNAWRGHFLVHVVHNENINFEMKMQRVARFIGGVVGIANIEDIISTCKVSSVLSLNSVINDNTGDEKEKIIQDHKILTTIPVKPVLSEEQEKEKEKNTREEKEKVARMAYLATGTRVFANNASMTSLIPANSPLYHNKKNDKNNNNENNNKNKEEEISNPSPPLPPPNTNIPLTSSDENSFKNNLQRHFFVNRVDMDRIPADAILANVVIVTLHPTREEYSSEVIIRLARANAAHPVYFRRVEYHKPVNQQTISSILLEDNNNNNNKSNINSNDKSDISINPTMNKETHRMTRVTISRETFLKLARRRDFSQPVIQKTTRRFFKNMRHFTLVSFQQPKELRGFCRLVAPAETTEEDIADWVEVEPYSLLMKEGVM